MKRTRQFFSAFAASAYLAATLLPCEIPQDLRGASLIGHAQPATSSVVSNESHHDHAVRGESHHGRHDHSNATLHHRSESGRSHDHPPDPPQDSQQNPSADHAGRADHAGHEFAGVRGASSRLSFRAKCLCGCDQTRSMVGGGAARLGSVILAEAAPRLVIDEISYVSVDSVRAFALVSLSGDPIPI